MKEQEQEQEHLDHSHDDQEVARHGGHTEGVEYQGQAQVVEGGREGGATATEERSQEVENKYEGQRQKNINKTGKKVFCWGTF